MATADNTEQPSQEMMMTTVLPILTEDEVDAFAGALKDWPNSEVVYESYELAASPFATLYFEYDPREHLAASLALIDIHERFEALSGHAYQIATHPESERPHPYGSKRLPNLREFAPKKPLQKNFLFKFTDQTNPLSSPNVAGYFWRSSTWDDKNNNAYSYVQLYVRWQWWLDHRAQWRDFLLEAADILKADQVYSGFAMANPLDIGARYEVAVWERALATRFYGLDIDVPFSMAMGLQKGIRPPTWGFLLSNRWRDKLGLSREQVRAALDDPQIRIEDRTCGQWIELGKQPSLCPVEQGVPPLQARLNRLLHPIRVKELGLVGFGQWDGDPNERFGMVDTQRWLARFDDDSDWPRPDLRPPAAPPESRMRCDANQPCPKAGFWFTPAQAGSRRFFSIGEAMPEVGGDYGATIWQWDQNQEPPKL
jgi:hypothetical protein